MTPIKIYSEPNEKDYQAMEKSWIPRDLADRALIRRVTSSEGAQIIGRNGAGNYASLLFPFILPGEGNIRDNRLRRDHPELEYKSDGTTRERQKYLSPPGRSNLLYFPPDIDPALLENTAVTVITVKGEKKTLALWRLAGRAGSQVRFLPVPFADHFPTIFTPVAHLQNHMYE